MYRNLVQAKMREQSYQLAIAHQLDTIAAFQNIDEDSLPASVECSQLCREFRCVSPQRPCANLSRIDLPRLVVCLAREKHAGCLCKIW